MMKVSRKDSIMIDDKVRIRCPRCTRVFRDKAYKVRDGYQVNCVNCTGLLTLNRDSEDPFIRRALKEARDIRAALEVRPTAQPAAPSIASIART
jgi:uncharacterized C2H2 Zn-finger protein